jgi:hypothetical protein
MGRHHRPESDFDETTKSWPAPDRVRYRKGFLDGLVTAWVLVLVGAGIYLVATRWGHLFAAIFTR